jgi:hypothetical protein
MRNIFKKLNEKLHENLIKILSVDPGSVNELNENISMKMSNEEQYIFFKKNPPQNQQQSLWGMNILKSTTNIFIENAACFIWAEANLWLDRKMYDWADIKYINRMDFGSFTCMVQHQFKRNSKNINLITGNYVTKFKTH